MKNIKLPDYWTPEQATAVFEFIDEIREAHAGSRYFCESLFWASQPKQAAKT